MISTDFRTPTTYKIKYTPLNHVKRAIGLDWLNATGHDYCGKLAAPGTGQAGTFMAVQLIIIHVYNSRMRFPAFLLPAEGA